MDKKVKGWNFDFESFFVGFMIAILIGTLVVAVLNPRGKTCKTSEVVLFDNDVLVSAWEDPAVKAEVVLFEPDEWQKKAPKLVPSVTPSKSEGTEITPPPPLPPPDFDDMAFIKEEISSPLPLILVGNCGYLKIYLKVGGNEYWIGEVYRQ